MKLQRMTFPHPPPPHLRSFAWLTMTGYDMIKCSSGFKGGGGLNGRQAVHPPPLRDSTPSRPFGLNLYYALFIFIRCFWSFLTSSENQFGQPIKRSSRRGRELSGRRVREAVTSVGVG